MFENLKLKMQSNNDIIVKNSNINIDINVGEEAVKIFNTERKFWKNLKGEVQ